MEHGWLTVMACIGLGSAVGVINVMYGRTGHAGAAAAGACGYSGTFAPAALSWVIVHVLAAIDSGELNLGDHYGAGETPDYPGTGGRPPDQGWRFL